MRHIRLCLRVKSPTDLRPCLSGALALALLAGCGKGSDSADSGGAGSATGPSFERVRDEVLRPSCGFDTCHGSGAGYFTISEDMGANELRNIPANQIPEMMRVVPYDPDQSYLIWKMEPKAGIMGDAMPPVPNSGPSDEQLQLVRDWISAGAR